MAPDLHIEVTQEDIDKGERGSCIDCPMALAGQRVVPAGDEVEVCDQYLVTGRGNDFTFYPLPPAAQAWVEAFDSGETVAPISFDLRPEVATIPIDTNEDMILCD